MLRESHRPGIEPATCKSQVQRPTAEPPRNIITTLISKTLRITRVKGITQFYLTGGRTNHFVTYLQFQVQVSFSADRSFVSRRYVQLRPKIFNPVNFPL